MPFEMPPPLPPQQAQTTQLVALSSQAAVYKIHSYRVHIAGCRGVPAGETEGAIASARDLSAVVRAMVRLSYLNQSPATQVYYSLAGADLYIYCAPQRITQVRGDRDLTPYFAGLSAAKVASTSDFESARALAAMHSDRAGLDGDVRFVQTQPGAVALEVGAVDSGERRAHIAVQADNSGNRFVGRDLVGADARYATRGAHEFRLGFRHALDGSGGQTATGNYDEGQAAWSTVTRLGLLGLESHGFYFTQDVSGAGRVKGSYAEGGGHWTPVLSAGFTHRALFQLRLAFADRTSVLSQSGSPSRLPVLHERYALAEPALTYAKAVIFDNSRLNLDSAASVAVGFPAGHRQFTPATMNFRVARLFLRGEWETNGWGRPGVSVLGQYSGRRVPEQQQWTLGGAGTLAAYLPAALLGDQGALGRLHWSAALFEGAWAKLTSRVFAEYGIARFAAASGQPAPETVHASDAGGGLGLTIGKTVTLAADAARPLTASAGLGDSRVNAYVSARVEF